MPPSFIEKGAFVHSVSYVAKARPESRGLATVSSVQKIQMVIVVCDNITQDTIFYLNSTREKGFCSQLQPHYPYLRLQDDADIYCSEYICRVVHCLEHTSNMSFGKRLLEIAAGSALSIPIF